MLCIAKIMYCFVGQKKKCHVRFAPRTSINIICPYQHIGPGMPVYLPSSSCGTTTSCTLHKNQGDRSDCNNYIGISILSIEGKYLPVLCSTYFRNWLRLSTHNNNPPGSRAGRSTIDYSCCDSCKRRVNSYTSPLSV